MTPLRLQVHDKQSQNGNAAQRSEQPAQRAGGLDGVLFINSVDVQEHHADNQQRQNPV